MECGVLEETEDTQTGSGDKKRGVLFLSQLSCCTKSTDILTTFCGPAGLR